MSVPKGPLSATLAAELGMSVDDGQDVDMNASAITPMASTVPPVTTPSPLGGASPRMPVTTPRSDPLPGTPALNSVRTDSTDLPSLEITSTFGDEPPTGSRSVASAWPGAAPSAPTTPARPVASALPALPPTAPPPQTPPSAEEAAKWQEVIAGYEREAKALGADRRSAPLWFEIGRVFEERLLQPRQAATSYQLAFKTDTGFVPVIHAARRLFQDINNWPMVVVLLDAELAVEKRPRNRSGLLVEKARIQEAKLNKPEDAMTSYRAAFESDPTFVPALDALERVLRPKNVPAEIADLLRRAIAALPVGFPRAERSLELAHLLEGSLNRQEDAVKAYTDVLEADPGCATALHALERLFARLGRHEELINVLTRLWEAAPNAEDVASIPLAVSRVARYSLKDDSRALAVLERARHRTPRDTAILRALAEVYASAGRHQEHVEVLVALAAAAKDDKQRAALHYDAGVILEDRLKDEAGAIAQYREVCRIYSSYLPALQALGRLYQRSGRFEELAQMYEAQIASLEDAAQKVPRLFKLAELRVAALGDEEGAIKCYRDILKLSPGYVPAIKALQGLLTQGGRWDELIALHEDDLQQTTDRDQTIFLLDKIAQIQEQKQGKLDEAIATYQRILKTAANYLPAIRALGVLFERTERWKDLLRSGALEADLTQDQKQVVALLHRNGEILEDNLADKDGAIAAYKKVLALSPNYLPTLKCLGRLYNSSGAWKELISMYRQEAEIARQAETRADLLFKIGQLYEERQQDPGKAVAAYRETLKEKKDHHAAVRALMRLSLAGGDYNAFVELAQVEATLFSDPPEQAHTLYQAGVVLAGPLGRPAEAGALYQRALDLHPTFDAALSALVELASTTGDLKAEQNALKRALDATAKGPRWVSVAKNLADLLGERMGELEAAARLYDQILEQDAADLFALRGAVALALRRRDWPRAIHAASQLALREPDADAAASLFLQVAAWKQYHVDPPQDPLPAYLKVLEYSPHDPVATRAVERAYRRTQSWAALYELYDRERESIQDKGQQLDICMRMADLATFNLQNDEQAVSALEKALSADGTYMPALRRLGPLYEKLGRHSEKLQLLALEAESTKDPTRAFNTLLEVAQIQETKFENVDAAVDCYFRVLDRDPKHPLALSKLDALLTRNQKWDRLVDLLGRKAAFAVDNAEKSELLMRAAQLMVERLDKREDAVGVLTTLLRMSPAHIPALQLISDLHDKAGRNLEAAQSFQALLPLTSDPAAAAGINKRLAQLFKTLNEPARAAQHYGAALAARPSDMPLAKELTELYISQRAWQQAAEMLSAMGERDPDVSARVDHYSKLAKIMEEGFQDPRRALDSWRKVLELKSDHQGAVDRIVELGEQLGDFSVLVQAYQSMIASTAKTDKARLAAIHFRLALLYLQRLNAPEKGVPELKLTLECDPENVDARSILANIYARAPGTFGVAIEEHKRVLAAQPHRLDSYHDLWRIYDSQRLRDKQFVCSEIVHFFKSANEGEEFFYGDNKNKVRQDSDAQLNEADHENLLVHPKERGPVREIIRAVVPELHKVFPADLAAHGVGKADRLPPKTPDSVRKLCDNLMKALGGAEFELYLSKTKTMELATVMGDPPALIVGAEIIKRHQTREQRFLLAERMAGLYAGHQLFESWVPKQLNDFVHAACFAVDENYNAGPDLDQDLAKKIQKAISRATRKSLLEPVSEVSRLRGRWDAAQHIKAARYTRLRAALAMSNDLECAVRLTARTAGVTVNPSDAADLEKKLQRDDLRELFAFALSDEYAGLRQRLKFAVDS